MRIGFDGRYIQDHYHGIGRYAYELLRSLIELDQKHTYVVFWNPDLLNRRFDLQALFSHPRVESVPVRAPLFSPMEQALLPIHIWRQRIDLFHSPYVATPLLAPSPLLLTVHDLILEHYTSYLPGLWSRGYYHAVMRVSLRRAAHIMTVSEATCRDLIEYYHVSPPKVSVAPGAVDPQYKPATIMHIAAVRQTYNLPEHFVLWVGARRPHKNVGAVVGALARIQDQIPHALVLVGAPDMRFRDDLPARIEHERLQERIITIDNVPEKDMPALYSAADVYLCPSLMEGFGLPVLEAMACGCPVVASDRSSLPEVAGDAALLINPSDERALAEAMLRVLTDACLGQSLRARGLSQATRFSWPLTAQRTLKVYGLIEAAARDMTAAKNGRF